MKSALDYARDMARRSYAEGGVADQAEEASKEKFLAQELKGSAPQYDPEGGAKTAKKIGLGLYGMTQAGGVQDALGYMPNAEGGYEPSIKQNVKEGHYFPATMQAIGMVVPAAGKVGKVARAAEEVGKAAKAADAVSDVARAETGVGNAVASAEQQIAKPNIISKPDQTGTVGHILRANGYDVVPDGAAWRDALNEPAQFWTPSQLRDEFQKSLDYHNSLSPKDRMRHSNEVMGDVKRYLGEYSGKPGSLLSQNAKLQKATKEGLTWDGVGVETNGLSMSPALQWGKMNLCPEHGVCIDSCIGKKANQAYMQGGGKDIYGLTNDRGGMNVPRVNQLGRSILMFQRPDLFATRLSDQISGKAGEALGDGNMLGMRLNTYSDLPPSVWKPLFDAHPDVQFYDYTKLNTKPGGLNHHLTYSSSGVSTDDFTNPYQNWSGVNGMEDRLRRGDNVAMVFTHGDELPHTVNSEETGRSYRVVSGDTHDFRPIDKTPDGQEGVIIGLKNKDTETKAKSDMIGNHVDSGGFMVPFDPQYQRGESRVITRGKRKGETEPGPYVRDENGAQIPTNFSVTIPDQRRFKPTPGSNQQGAKRSDYVRRFNESIPDYGEDNYKRGGSVRRMPMRHYEQQFPNADHYLDDGLLHHSEWFEQGKKSSQARG